MAGNSILNLVKKTIEKQRVINLLRSTCKTKKIEDFFMLPGDLIHHLKRFVVKQDDAKLTLATHLIGHRNRLRYCINQGIDPMDNDAGVKPNILLVGPTGVGKTYLIKLIAREIGAPFAKYDATKFTESGYVGEKADNMVRGLYQKALDMVMADSEYKDLNILEQIDIAIYLTQYGYIFIDEFDKIAKPESSIGHDVSREGTQRSLLTIIEDRDIPLFDLQDPSTHLKLKSIAEANGGKIPDQKYINTKNIIFVFSGVFQGIHDIIKQRKSTAGIGFGATLKNQIEDAVVKELQTSDLVKFGIEGEIAGRIPVRASLEELDEDDLYAILKMENSPIVQHFILTMKSYNIDVQFEDEVFRLIAKKAYEEKTGARGLVTAMNYFLEIFQGKLPETKITSITITKELVSLSKAEIHEFIEVLKSEMLKVDGLTEYSESMEGFFDEFQKETGVRVILNESARTELYENSPVSLYKAAKIVFGEYKGLFTNIAKHGLQRIEIKSTMDILQSIRDEIAKDIKKVSFSDDGINAVKRVIKERTGLELKFSRDAIVEIYLFALRKRKTPVDVFNQVFGRLEDGLKLYQSMGGEDLNIDSNFVKDPMGSISKIIAEISK